MKTVSRMRWGRQIEIFRIGGETLVGVYNCVTDEITVEDARQALASSESVAPRFLKRLSAPQKQQIQDFCELRSPTPSD